MFDDKYSWDDDQPHIQDNPWASTPAPSPVSTPAAAPAPIQNPAASQPSPTPPAPTWSAPSYLSDSGDDGGGPPATPPPAAPRSRQRPAPPSTPPPGAEFGNIWVWHPDPHDDGSGDYEGGWYDFGPGPSSTLPGQRIDPDGVSGRELPPTDSSDPGGTDRRARTLISALKGDGHDVKSDGINRLIIDGRPYKLPDAPAQPTWDFKNYKAYEPGPITFDDLKNLSYDDVMKRLKTPESTATDQLVRQILEHPESLSDHDIEILKAKSADELADISGAQSADLKRFGWQNGLADSNWLASEENANQRARDQALIKSNRDIDVTAAQTRMGDRRAAAQIGTAYEAEQRAREGLANDTQLRQAALTGDRMALRESVKQKASELGLEADKVMQNFVIAQMEDLTRRYGIEVQGELDIARLSLQASQGWDDLSFKLEELRRRMGLAYDTLDQDDRHFGATYGLDWFDRMFPDGP